MEYGFWTGIIIGAAFSLVVSIVANLLTEDVRRFFRWQRDIQLSRWQKYETRTYQVLKALKAGSPEQYANLLLRQAEIIFSMFMAVLTTLMMMLFILTVMYGQNNLSPVVKSLFGYAITFSSFLASVFVLRGFALMMAYRIMNSKLRRFDRYENAIRKAWGDAALNGEVDHKK